MDDFWCCLGFNSLEYGGVKQVESDHFKFVNYVIVFVFLLFIKNHEQEN